MPFLSNICLPFFLLAIICVLLYVFPLKNFVLFNFTCTVSALKQFVKTHLEDPNLNFYLCKLKKAHTHARFGRDGNIFVCFVLISSWKCIFSDSHVKSESVGCAPSDILVGFCQARTGNLYSQQMLSGPVYMHCSFGKFSCTSISKFSVVAQPMLEHWIKWGDKGLLDWCPLLPFTEDVLAHPRSHAKNELDRKDAGIGPQQVQMAMLVPTGDDVKNMACFSEYLL